MRYKTTETTTKSNMSPANWPIFRSSPTTGLHDQPLQASPALSVANDRAGTTRLFDRLWMALLNELPSVSPTVNFSMSSLKANLL
jgi:outer membrane protein TolC